MILNTGQRTDIPAFFSEWFINRVNEGFVMVRNPYNPSAVTRFEIRPDLVDLIGFCTKNPLLLLPFVEELDKRGYGQYWQFTITPYGRDIEPGVPDKHECLEAFKKLARLVGKERVVWRYDPIFIDQKYTADYHRRAFETMARALSGWTDWCVISFIDLFPKVKKNFPEARPLDEQEQIALGKDLIEIAAANKIGIRTCGEGTVLKAYGADTDGCMTPAIYERAVGQPLNFPRFTPSRNECACYLSCDIGVYSTCRHFCRYCYANSNPQMIKENIARHDPRSPFIIGGPLPTDTVRQAEQKSWKASASSDGQRELF
ncbi:MAG: DUF1848 domain-containing protein [Treponema sp.]|nr:DUF1848 domain-containing protein [Treponema sp.]